MILALGLYLGDIARYPPSFWINMRKIIACTILLIVMSAFNTRPAFAVSNEAGASAGFKSQQITPPVFDYRVYSLRKFLDKNRSPLTPYSREFIAQADYYGLDWRIVPAISGVESTFGKAIPYDSYNAYGWVNGNYSFNSWPDSIRVVTKTLKNNYVDRGAVSIRSIARIYAPPSTTWASKVQYFVDKINPLPFSFDI